MPTSGDPLQELRDVHLPDPKSALWFFQMLTMWNYGPEGEE